MPLPKNNELPRNDADEWSILVTDANVDLIDPTDGFVHDGRLWRPVEVLANFSRPQTGILAADTDVKLIELPLNVVPGIEPFTDFRPETPKTPVGYMATIPHYVRAKDRNMLTRDYLSILRISDGAEDGALPTEIRFGIHPEYDYTPRFVIGAQLLGRVSLKEKEEVKYLPEDKISFKYFPIFSDRSNI